MLVGQWTLGILLLCIYCTTKEANWVLEIKDVANKTSLSTCFNLNLDNPQHTYGSPQLSIISVGGDTVPSSGFHGQGRHLVHKHRSRQHTHTQKINLEDYPMTVLVGFYCCDKGHGQKQLNEEGLISASNSQVTNQHWWKSGQGRPQRVLLPGLMLRVCSTRSLRQHRTACSMAVPTTVGWPSHINHCLQADLTEALSQLSSFFPMT